MYFPLAFHFGSRYPFGFGLGWTTFSLKEVSLQDENVAVNGEVTLRLVVENTGARRGSEVVQIYVRKMQTTPDVPRPLKQLVGFQRVKVAKGEKRVVNFSIPQREFAIWDVGTQKFVTTPGAYEFMAAASSEDIRQRGVVEIP